MAKIREGDQAGIRESSATAIDLAWIVCEHGWCETYRDGTWLYRDGLHISPTFSELISTEFIDALQ